MVLSIRKASRLEYFSAVLVLLGTLGLGLLSAVDQRRSIKPSNLAVLYLIGSSFSSALELTFPGNNKSLPLSHPLKWLHLADLVTRLVLLVLECRRKPGNRLSSHLSDCLPEEVPGLLSSAFFWWVNGLLFKGYKRILCLDDIPRLDGKLAPQALRVAIQRNWDLRGLSFATWGNLPSH
ncbi:hypothetical protein HIM_04308 [Hirsutella minnesotensis 3608]|uniref:Uncharacterized protein n=1 Tax=Hirsutella minnesotensis 3608 TaxID=1043627 RepID=A0A0F7ZLB9_9HYPO|nr:hypothetical protein HIM_04308 [Hirsutella minnesotensis 3608]